MINTITKTDRAFPLIHFVAKIVPAHLEQDQFNLGYIKATKELLISTDGHRLHTADNSQIGLAPGYYVVVKCLKTQVQIDKLDGEHKFPDSAAITDRDISSHKTFNLVDTSRDYDIHSNFALVIRAMDQDITLNIDYLRDAIDNEEVLTAAIPEDASPSVFYGARCRAYIMPMEM